MDFALAEVLAVMVVFWGVMLYVFVLSMPTEDDFPETETLSGQDAPTMAFA